MEGSLNIKIHRPDDIIPFTELICRAPFFRVQRPKIVGEFEVGLINDATPIKMTATSKADEVAIYKDDLHEFIAQLDRYTKYVQHNINLRTPENILKTLATTKKGRRLLTDFVKNMNYNEDTHSTDNGEISLSQWTIKRLEEEE